MSNYSFGNISADSKKKILNLQTVSNPVLIDKSERNGKNLICVLVDELYNNIQLRAICLFLESLGIIKYKIIYALTSVISKEEIKSSQNTGIIEFYRNNSIDYMKYIPRDALVITSGPALYTLVPGGDVYPSYVHQRIFGVSHFWASKKQNSDGHWVFPIDSFVDIFAVGFSTKAVDSYITKLAMMQCNDALHFNSIKPPYNPRLRKVFIESKDEFHEKVYMKYRDKKNQLMCYDLETSGFNPWVDKIGCVTISFDGIEGFYVPWSCVNVLELDELFRNNFNLGANLKFDIKFLWKNGCRHARVDHDTFVLGHMLDETRGNSLKTHAYLYTIYGGYDEPLEDYKRKNKVVSYLDIPEATLKEYAILDAIVCWQVFDRMYQHATILNGKYRNDEKTFGWDLLRYYNELRIPAVNRYAKMEYEGCYINVDKLNALRVQVTQFIRETKATLASEFGVDLEFNWGDEDCVEEFGGFGEFKSTDFNSAESLGKLLEERGWECYGKNKKGIYSTGDEQLSLWALKHKEAKHIQTLRSARTILNGFLGDEAGTKGWPQYIVYHPEDGSYRMHSNYGCMATESGRTRSAEPNLQNVPTHGLFAKEIKSCLCTPDDDNYYMLTADGSGLQMRLATADGEDEVLMNEYWKNVKADIHSATAFGIFVEGKSFIKVEQDGHTFYFQELTDVPLINGDKKPAQNLVETDTLDVEALLKKD